MKTCPQCRQKVSYKKSFTRDNTINIRKRSQKELYILKGWCPNCQIELRKTIKGTVEGTIESKWYIRKIKNLKDLPPAISEFELQEIERKLHRHIENRYKWKKFLSYRKSNDTIHRFKHLNGSQKNISIIRKDMIIAEFSAFIEL